MSRVTTSQSNPMTYLHSVTKPHRIINQEQAEAHQAAARAANPNATRIESLRAQSRALSEQAAALTSDQERYWNLMAALSSGFDSKVGAAKVMSDQEIGDHLSNLFFEHTHGEMDEAILMEALDRIGWRAEDDI